MDQKKAGCFFKELRKEKGLTQENLAERLNISGRTVSRWETGRNMPDLDILIEMSDFYKVDIRELIDGERKSEKMNQKEEETVLKVADYSNEEKKQLMQRMHVLSWVGVITFIIFLVMEIMGLAESGVTEIIASFCCGVSFGILIITVIYTSRSIHKITEFKRRLVHRK